MPLVDGRAELRWLNDASRSDSVSTGVRSNLVRTHIWSCLRTSEGSGNYEDGGGRGA